MPTGTFRLVPGLYSEYEVGGCLRNNRICLHSESDPVYFTGSASLHPPSHGHVPSRTWLLLRGQGHAGAWRMSMAHGDVHGALVFGGGAGRRYSLHLVRRNLLYAACRRTDHLLRGAGTAGGSLLLFFV